MVGDFSTGSAHALIVGNREIDLEALSPAALSFMTHTQEGSFFHKTQQSSKMQSEMRRRLRLLFEQRRQSQIDNAKRKGEEPKNIAMCKVDPAQVTLCMEIPRNDHSEIIINRSGIYKWSDSVSKILVETNTRIEFPDRDDLVLDAQSQFPCRSSPNLTRFANQVTITGSIENVNEARLRLRKMCPLIICFPISSAKSEFPVSRLTSWLAESLSDGTLNFPHICIQVVPPALNPFETLQHASQQQKFLMGPAIRITGRVCDEEEILNACDALRERLFEEEEAAKLTFSSHIDIPSAHWRAIVGGEGFPIMVLVSKCTSAYIYFPDKVDELSPHSGFFCSGPAASVLKARKFIQGLLPVYLCFDAPSSLLSRPPPPNADRSFIRFDAEHLVTLSMQKSDLESETLLTGEEYRHFIALSTCEWNVQCLFSAYRSLLTNASEVPMCGPSDYDVVLNDTEFRSTVCKYVTENLTPCRVAPVVDPSLAPAPTSRTRSETGCADESYAETLPESCALVGAEGDSVHDAVGFVSPTSSVHMSVNSGDGHSHPHGALSQPGYVFGSSSSPSPTSPVKYDRERGPFHRMFKGNHHHIRPHPRDRPFTSAPFADRRPFPGRRGGLPLHYSSKQHPLRLFRTGTDIHSRDENQAPVLHPHPHSAHWAVAGAENIESPPPSLLHIDNAALMGSMSSGIDENGSVCGGPAPSQASSSSNKTSYYHPHHERSERSAARPLSSINTFWPRSDPMRRMTRNRPFHQDSDMLYKDYGRRFEPLYGGCPSPSGSRRQQLDRPPGKIELKYREPEMRRADYGESHQNLTKPQSIPHLASTGTEPSPSHSHQAPSSGNKSESQLYHLAQSPDSGAEMSHTRSYADIAGRMNVLDLIKLAAKDPQSVEHNKEMRKADEGDRSTATYAQILEGRRANSSPWNGHHPLPLSHGHQYLPSTCGVSPNYLITMSGCLQLQRFLSTIGCSELLDLLIRNNVDLSVLPHLRERDLEAMGIYNQSIRLLLMSAAGVHRLHQGFHHG